MCVIGLSHRSEMYTEQKALGLQVCARAELHHKNFFIFLLFGLNKISLYSSGRPGILYVDEAGLKLTM